MNRKSVEFNNAGVEFISLGWFEDAHVLFQAALNSHLAEVNAHDGLLNATTNPSPIVPADNAGADDGSDVGMHVCGDSTTDEERTIDIPKEICTTTTSETSATTTSSSCGYDTCSSSPDNNETVAKKSSSCLLYQRAFAIEETDLAPGNILAVIRVFNVGLAHHLLDSYSWKAKSFYEYAALILAINVPNTVVNDGDGEGDNDDGLNSPPPQDLRSGLQRAILMNLRTMNDQGSTTNSHDQTSTDNNNNKEKEHPPMDYMTEIKNGMDEDTTSSIFSQW
eukprot:scaffold5360_cov213-Amphora_coffeaeformis.AAC.1